MTNPMTQQQYDDLTYAAIRLKVPCNPRRWAWNRAMSLGLHPELSGVVAPPVDQAQQRQAIPTVHLNGTSRGELLSQLSDAIGGCDAALTKLGRAAPHARDYYVQSDPDAFTKAQAAHRERLTKITAVRDELLEIAEAINE